MAVKHSRFWSIIVLVTVLLGTCAAGRWHEDQLPMHIEASLEHPDALEQAEKPLLVSTGPRPPTDILDQGSHHSEQPLAAGAFGDYFYQDYATSNKEIAEQASSQSDSLAEENWGQRSSDAGDQNRAYLLEDRAGRLSVVEQETRELPGGGQMMWQRTTGPDGVVVTTVSSSSADESGDLQDVLDSVPTSNSMFSFMDQISSGGFLSSAMNSAFTPINQLLDALDAQQQQLSAMLTSQHMRAAAAQAQQQHEPQGMQQHMPHMMVHRRPCPRHQAMLAAAAAAAAQQQERQVSEYSQQVAAQQAEQAASVSHQERLQELWARNGLVVTDTGDVVPLAEEQQEAAAGWMDLEYYDETYAGDDGSYVDSSSQEAVSADFADTEYETGDGGDVTDTDSDADYDLDAASMGDYSYRLAGLLDALAENMPELTSVDLSNWFNVDFLLLMLLVSCTVGMCMLFLQSVLQLRTVLAAGSNLEAGILPIKVAGPFPVAVAAGLKGINSGKGSEDDLALPLLPAEDVQSAVEQQQQQQQQGAGVQRFYNPMHYQPLPAKQ